MKKTLFFIVICLLTFHPKTWSQDDYQTITTGGFKVKCFCRLRSNSTFLQLARQQGIHNTIGAYICTENEDNPSIGVLVNINVYDELEAYKKIEPSGYAYFEKQYIIEYAEIFRMQASHIAISPTKVLLAVEYTYDQMGVPTKALVFIKNKKSYLIQVATRKSLNTKYDYIKGSFHFL